MNFIPSQFCDRYRPGLTARRGAATIGLSLALLAIAHTAMAKPTTPPAKPAQTIALQITDSPAPIASPAHDFRLLGYGLFLLQIGLIPLKLAKGNKVETMIFDRPETNAPD